MSRTIGELARAAYAAGWTFGLLTLELVDAPDRVAGVLELTREELELLDELPPVSGADFDAMARLAAHNPIGAQRLLSCSPRELELLRQVPLECLSPRPSSAPPPARATRASDAGLERVEAPKDEKEIAAIAEAASVQEREAKAAAINQLPPKHARRVAAETRVQRYRNRVKFAGKKGVQWSERLQPLPDGGWIKLGMARRDPDDWMRRGRRSNDPTEREVCQRLSREPWVLVRQLGFVLWSLMKEDPDRHASTRPYVGVVAGYSRGDLARFVAYSNAAGVAVHPDTVTRALRDLKQCLRGILEHHQPDPESVDRYNLPGAKQRLVDGSTLLQAFNVYWFRKYEKTALPDGAPVPPGPDRRSAYATNSKQNKDLRPSAVQGCGVAADGDGRSGGRGPPHCGPPSSDDGPAVPDAPSKAG